MVVIQIGKKRYWRNYPAGIIDSGHMVNPVVIFDSQQQFLKIFTKTDELANISILLLSNRKLILIFEIYN